LVAINARPALFGGDGDVTAMVPKESTLARASISGPARQMRILALNNYDLERIACA